MLRVNTMLLPSSLQGIGLFADEFIKKGTVTWKRDPEDFSFEMDKYLMRFRKKVRDHQREYVKAHSYFDAETGLWVYCVDALKYINHSEAPNVISTPFVDIAARNIHPGDEMTCNYAAYEPPGADGIDWFKRRGVNRGDFKPFVEDDEKRVYVVMPARKKRTRT